MLQSRITKVAVLTSVVLVIVLSISGCATPDYRYHMRFWEWYNLNAEKSLSQGDRQHAEQFYLSALREARNFGPTDLHLIISLNRLAEIYRLEEKNSEAEKLYSQALKGLGGRTSAVEHTSPLRDSERLRALLGMAQIAASKGNYSQAESLYKSILELERPNWASKDSAETASEAGRALVSSLCGLADVYWKTGRFGDAEKLLSEALSVAASASVPDTLSQNIAGEYVRLLGSMSKEFYGKQIASLMADYPLLSSSGNALPTNVTVWLNSYKAARDALSRHHWPEARDLFALALKQTKDFSPFDPRIPVTLDGLAAALGGCHDEMREKSVLLKALEIRRGSADTPPLELALNLQAIGNLLLDTNSSLEAKTYYEEEFSIIAKTMRFNHDELLLTMPMLQLATIYSRFGPTPNDFARGESLSKQQIPLVEEKFGHSSMRYYDCLFALADSYLNQQKTPEAEETLVRLISSYDKSGIKKLPRYAWSLDRLADAYEAQKRTSKYAETLRQAISVWDKLDGTDSVGAALDRMRLARLLVSDGKPEEAIEYAKRAIASASDFAVKQRVKMAQDGLAVFDGCANLHTKISTTPLYALLPPLINGVKEEENNTLLRIHMSIAREEKSDRYMEDKIQTLEKQLPASSKTLARILDGMLNFAQECATQGSLDEALAMTKRVLASAEKLTPEDQRTRVVFSVWKGDDFSKLGKWAESAAYFELTLPRLERDEGYDPSVVSRYCILVEDYLRMGDLRRAEKSADEILRKLNRTIPKPEDLLPRLRSSPHPSKTILDVAYGADISKPEVSAFYNQVLTNLEGIRGKDFYQRFPFPPQRRL